ARDRGRCHLVKVQDYTGTAFDEPLKKVRNDRKCDRERACDPNFTRCRVRQVLDVLDALLQLVEHDERALEQGMAIAGRLDALRASVKESYAEPMLQIGNDLRHRWNGYTELRRCFRHATALRDDEKHMQVAQSQPAADLAVPIDLFEH